MQSYERILRVMKSVVFYSNTGESEKIATFLAKELEFSMFELSMCEQKDFSDLVLVFPVLCQNVPKPVKNFLSVVEVKNLTLIATYGGINHGNVINEAKKLFAGKLVSAAYVPTKHSYLDEQGFSDYHALFPLIEKIKSPASEVSVPKAPKNVFANLYPEKRSRLGVKIIRTSDCKNCGTCTKSCPNHAIVNGITNNKCLRCLRCVQVCPFQGLTFKLSAPMKLYLRKKPNNKVEIFV